MTDGRDNQPLRIVGWGPFALPGENRLMLDAARRVNEAVERLEPTLALVDAAPHPDALVSPEIADAAFLKREIEKLLADSIEEFEVDYDLNSPFIQLLHQQLETISALRFYVVLLGSTNSGKTSLVNALTDLESFPVSPLPQLTTFAAATKRRVHVDVHYSSGTTRTIEVDPSSTQLTDVMAGTIAGGSARALHIESPDITLPRDVVLIDTPGLGEVNASHASVTLAAMASADLLVFTTSAVSPLSSIELSFIARAFEMNLRVIIALTKVDLVDNPSRIVSHARQMITNATGVANSDIVILPVSSDWHTNERPGDEAETTSGISQLKQALWRTLNASRKMETIQNSGMLLVEALQAQDRLLASSRTNITRDRETVRRDSRTQRLLKRAQDLLASSDMQDRVIR